MPLIDLKTDLKSLKFGNDRPQGGSSNQPYIQTQIPDDDKQGIPSTEDFLLRGGLSAPLNAAKDVSRLTQMFFDSKDPSGLLFTAKENLLSRTGVKTEASTTAGAIYTPLSTLGQSAIGFAGGHLNLLGLDPTGLSSLGVPSYYDYIKELKKEKTRLFSLSKIETKKLPSGIQLFPLGKSSTTFMEYGGGPGSILGIGKTSLKFTTNPTRNSGKRTWEMGKIIGNYKTWDNSLIESAPDNKTKTEGNPSIQDFRKGLLEGNKSTIMSSAPDYTNNKPTQRVNYGDPGNNIDYNGKKKNVYNYSTGGKIVDAINASGIYESNGPPLQSDTRRDLVNFSIGILQNTEGSKADFMNFRSFIDSFDDSYSADWGSTQYAGRGDKFHNYQGFDRSINMSFTVYAQSKAELLPMYRRLNFLASSLAPSYSTGGFMQGNLVYLSLGGYLYKQLGIIKSLTYTIPQESTWEIGIDEKGDVDKTTSVLPHMIKVSGLSFTPIHEFLPSKSIDTQNQKQKYIALYNEGGPNLYDNTGVVGEVTFGNLVTDRDKNGNFTKLDKIQSKPITLPSPVSNIPITPFNSL
ncbi:hypothetical protein N9P60_00115 [bacterium]|nr:hypothetical protein [bacterium]MDB4319832.1 hypothetical protein [bacterium]